MRHQLVYDLPTRLFHWLFAGLFIAAFAIAKTVDDETILFSFHSIAGLTLGFLVVLRVIWGVFGTKHAKFSGFALNPKDLALYFSGILSGEKKRWAGHNPASSWAALTMMGFAAGLAITGYLMTSGINKEDYEDIHEIFANGFIIVVILHVTGIILHSLRYKEMIAMSMVDGKKSDVALDDVVDSPKNALGILLIGLVFAFGIQLVSNFDTKSGTLNFFGTALQIGEAPENEQGENPGLEKNENAEQEDND